MSPSTAEQTLLEEESKLRIPNEYYFETTVSFGQNADWWKQANFDLIILVLPDDLQLQLFFVQKLKSGDVPKDLPFIFISKKITQEMLSLSSIFQRVRMIKAPVTGETMHQTMDALLIKRPPGKVQLHPRFITEQNVKAFFGDMKNPVQMQLRNLSKGGAYLEAHRDEVQLIRGDIIKVQFTLQNPTKEYNLDARVVWIKDLDGATLSMGVSFLGKEEVYNELLKNF